MSRFSNGVSFPSISLEMYYVGHDRVCGKDACCGFQTGQPYSSNSLWTHQKLVLGTRGFHRTLLMQACAYLHPLIDLFHLTTIDEVWDLHKRSSERRTLRCLCGVGTLIQHTLVFLGRLYFLKTMCNTNLRFVGGFLEHYQVLWREEHDRLLRYGKNRFQ